MARVVPRRIEPSTVEGQVLRTVNGIVVWSDEGTGATGSRTSLAPWTATVAGVPQNVYDSNDSVVMTEVYL